MTTETGWTKLGPGRWRRKGDHQPEVSFTDANGEPSDIDPDIALGCFYARFAYTGNLALGIARIGKPHIRRAVAKRMATDPAERRQIAEYLLGQRKITNLERRIITLKEAQLAELKRHVAALQHYAETKLTGEAGVAEFIRRFPPSIDEGSRVIDALLLELLKDKVIVIDKDTGLIYELILPT